MQAHPKIEFPPHPNSTWYRPKASQMPVLITHALILPMLFQSGFVYFWSTITPYLISHTYSCYSDFIIFFCVFMGLCLFPLTGGVGERENIAHQSLGLGWLEQVWSEGGVLWTQRPAAFSLGQGYGSNEGNCLLFIFLPRLVCFIAEKQLSWHKQYTQSFRHVLWMFPFSLSRCE